MTGGAVRFFLGRQFLAGAACAFSLFAASFSTSAARADEPMAFIQSVTAAAAEDTVITTFYAARNFSTLWTGADDSVRRAAFLAALARAGDHGLPVARYDAGALSAAFAAAQTERDRGQLEVRMTRAFLDYARDLSSGVLVPTKAVHGLRRKVEGLDPALLLAAMADGRPGAVLRGLVPDAPEYARLMKEKFTLEAALADGWGPQVVAEKLQPGDTGAAVIALRDRLVRLGYLRRSATVSYDTAITAAVQRFQTDHGLAADGVAGKGTIAEINVGPEGRLKAVVVAMERLRWMRGLDRGARHIWVNQPDFTAKIIDHGRVTFQTRAVIGKNVPDQESPEFSDFMEYMVVNPSWGVPRSITVKEYLPLLQQDPNAVAHLDVIDNTTGQIVPRESVDFAAFTDSTFPFALRQAPSDGNALGKVKFMFPNPDNIYLHDTPAKDLFAKEVRAYSHGCIRLADPFDFARALLAVQTDDPQGQFQRALAGGEETVLGLKSPVPVHLVYFTAWPDAKGRMTYRRDIYGRDGAIFDALSEAGVVLRGVQG